jgi:signal transduction histidine kinase
LLDEMAGCRHNQVMAMASSKLEKRESDSAETVRIFKMIIVYRWISLIPPLIMLGVAIVRGQFEPIALFVLLAAIAANFLISFFTVPLNRALRRQPLVLLFDLSFVSFLIALSGGVESPYILYALNPIIIAAFFFQVRGAMVAAGAFVPLYLLAVGVNSRLTNSTLDLLDLLPILPGFFLLGGAFGYASSLIERLQQTQVDLLDAQETIADNTAIELEAARLRSERAHHAAIDAERLRIARDMHDTVSQSLFGLAFGLRGTEQMLPEYPAEAKVELAALTEVAQELRTDVRQIIFDIWPDELTAERFSADLQRYVNDLNPQPTLALDLDIRGDFAPLSPSARRSLYRICQESLANIANHASAENARVCLDITGGRASLIIRDDGVGFNPANVTVHNNSDEHFGLRGMQERTRAMGGTFDVFSRPDAGTSIVIDVPINNNEPTN